MKARERKHLLITLAALVLVGCGPSVDIHQDAERGNIGAVKQAIADGSYVNAKDKVGVTPLTYATFKGDKEITKLLIIAGADVNTKNDDGETLLDLSDVDDVYNKEIVDLLRKHGGKTGKE